MLQVNKLYNIERKRKANRDIWCCDIFAFKIAFKLTYIIIVDVETFSKLLLTFCLWDKPKYESSKFTWIDINQNIYVSWRKIDPRKEDQTLCIYSKKNWLDTFVYVIGILW